MLVLIKHKQPKYVGFVRVCIAKHKTIEIVKKKKIVNNKTKICIICNKSPSAQIIIIFIKLLFILFSSAFFFVQICGYWQRNILLKCERCQRNYGK